MIRFFVIRIMEILLLCEWMTLNIIFEYKTIDKLKKYLWQVLSHKQMCSHILEFCSNHPVVHKRILIECSSYIEISAIFLLIFQNDVWCTCWDSVIGVEKFGKNQRFEPPVCYQIRSVGFTYFKLNVFVNLVVSFDIQTSCTVYNFQYVLFNKFFF